MKAPVLTWLVLALSSLVAAPVVAQAPSESASPAPAAAPGSDESLRSLIDQELEPDPTGYAYNSQSRRDPFVSLLKPVSADQGPGKRKAGLEGFLIQEVALKGIVKDREGYIALLQVPDAKMTTYFPKVGQRLFDGVITSIDATTVTFRQEITDPLSNVKSRDVKKFLYPSEEARQ